MPANSLRVISDADLNREERLRRGLRVELAQRGVDPSGVLDLLDVVTKDEIWTSLGLRSFAELIEAPWPAGIGWRVEDVKTIMKLRHSHEDKDRKTAARMAALRQRVTDLLTDDELPRDGEVGRGRNRFRITKPIQDDATYALRRLKRDRPDLAQRVLAGELSAHAAAIEAGFRSKTITAPLDPKKLARAIRRRLTDDEVVTLIDALGEGVPVPTDQSPLER